MPLGIARTVALTLMVDSAALPGFLFGKTPTISPEVLSFHCIAVYAYIHVVQTMYFSNLRLFCLLRGISVNEIKI